MLVSLVRVSLQTLGETTAKGHQVLVRAVTKGQSPHTPGPPGIASRCKLWTKHWPKASGCSLYGSETPCNPWLKSTPTCQWQKVSRKRNALHLWLKHVPKVNDCRLTSSFTPCNFWSRHSPKVGGCRLLDSATPCKLRAKHPPKTMAVGCSATQHPASSG